MTEEQMKSLKVGDTFAVLLEVTAAAEERIPGILSIEAQPVGHNGTENSHVYDTECLSVVALGEPPCYEKRDIAAGALLHRVFPSIIKQLEKRLQKIDATWRISKFRTSKVGCEKLYHGAVFTTNDKAGETFDVELQNNGTLIYNVAQFGLKADELEVFYSASHTLASLWGAYMEMLLKEYGMRKEEA